MKLTRSALAGRPRPLQLISVFCGSSGSTEDRTRDDANGDTVLRHPPCLATRI